MAKKIPEVIRDRVLERPDVFRKIAHMDDAELDDLMANIDGWQVTHDPRWQASRALAFGQ